MMIFCLILLVSSTLLHSIHVHEFTKQSSWKNFFPAYDVLTYFLDYQRDINAPNLKAKLNELGISDPEINLIKNWMPSQEIISDIQIRAIKNLIPSSNISLLKGSLIMFQDYICSRITLFLVFSSLALFCGLKKVKLGLGVLSVFFIISTYLITFKKLPERAYLPFLSLIPLSSFFFNWENLLSSVRKPFVAIFIFTLLWMNVSQLRFIKKTTHQHLLINEQLILDINDLERSPQITYLWRNDSWFEHLPVLKFPSKEMKDLNLIGFGWLSRSAYSINRSMKLGAINPILGSVDNDKMLWVSDTDTNKALKDFIKHKYNLLVQFDLVQQGKILQVWKVRRL
ncbi:MAG: hypothetical protein ACKOA8_10130 [Deltaproteobacteria bacterium]